jgi:hypothetical protein
VTRYNPAKLLEDEADDRVLILEWCLIPCDGWEPHDPNYSFETTWAWRRYHSSNNGRIAFMLHNRQNTVPLLLRQNETNNHE